MTDESHLRDSCDPTSISPYPRTAPDAQDVDLSSRWESQDDPSFSIDSEQTHNESELSRDLTESRSPEQDVTSASQDQNRRYRPPHTPEDTQKIEEMLHAGYRPLEIRKVLPHISKSNIYLKYNKFRKEGTSLADKAAYRKTGRPKKLGDHLEGFIADLLVSKPGLELAEIAELLQKEKGVECSTTSVSRAIARVQGPRGRGLKSRRLGELKREKLEREGALGDQGVWRGRTGIVYAKGLNQETIRLERSEPNQERDAQQTSQSDEPATAERTSEENTVRQPAEGQGDDEMSLEPQLRSPKQVVNADHAQPDIYESPYLPMQHGIDPADLSAIRSLVNQKRRNET